MKKLKIMAGICAVICIICVARLSIADEYRDLEIKPLHSAQAEANGGPMMQSQETQYRVVDTYRLEERIRH